MSVFRVASTCTSDQTLRRNGKNAGVFEVEIRMPPPDISLRQLLQASRGERPRQREKGRRAVKVPTAPCCHLSWSWFSFFCRASLEPPTRNINSGLYIVCHFGKQIASHLAGFFCFDLQFSNVRSVQVRNLQVYLGKPAPQLFQLPDDTYQIRRHANARHRLRATVVLLQNSAQGISIAVLIRLVRFGHQPFTVGTIRFVSCKVGMDLFGYFSVEPLQFWRRCDCRCSGSLPMSGRIRLLGVRAGLCRGGPRLLRAFPFSNQLSDLCCSVVEFGIEHPNLAKIAALEG